MAPNSPPVSIPSPTSPPSYSLVVVDCLSRPLAGRQSLCALWAQKRTYWRPLQSIFLNRFYSCRLQPSPDTMPSVTADTINTSPSAFWNGIEPVIIQVQSRLCGIIVELDKPISIPSSKRTPGRALRRLLAAKKQQLFHHAMAAIVEGPRDLEMVFQQCVETDGMVSWMHRTRFE